MRRAEEEKSLSCGLRMCYNKDNKQDEEVINMRNPLIITIGREYGSGGREIGELVAKTLGIAYYDKKLITPGKYLIAEITVLSYHTCTKKARKSSDYL